MNLTTRQRTVLATLEMHNHMTPPTIGVRRDVLWRLEERGLAARNSHDEWHITAAGRAALAASHV